MNFKIISNINDKKINKILIGFINPFYYNIIWNIERQTNIVERVLLLNLFIKLLKINHYSLV